MVQYLINLTATWLLSLLAFDLLLRRESYHSYNRLYLLFTLAMGIFLPLWQWDAGNEVYQTVSNTGAYNNIVTTKQNLLTAAAPAQPEMSLALWLWLFYFAGVAVFTLLLTREIFVLTRLYRNGKKSKDGVWNIIETGKKHSPFSAFRYVFISTKADYNPQELRMILIHEEQHGYSLHFIDTMLMQLAKIIFWFHPLVHLYNQRLLAVHEYQADAANETDAKVYGRFLIQQAVLHSAPGIAHSFNRSPIKNRIVMLTRKSTFTSGFKRFAFIPLCIVCAFFFTENAASKESRKEGNKIYYGGNVFELWSPYPGPDTVMVQNPATGEMEMRIMRVDSFPVKMNGREIFRAGELSKMETEEFERTTQQEVNNYFVERMKPVIAKMPDGNYSIDGYIILDEKGKIVYVIEPNIGDRDWRMNKTDSYTAMVNSLKKDLLSILQKTTKTFTPAKRSSKAEIVRLESLFKPRTTFRVKDHRVTVEAK